jgi:CheY-like chemotaxis protein
MNYMESTLPILIIDDDLANKHIMQVAFREAQIRNPTTFVFDGQQALDHLQSCTADRLPALILLDLNMPRMTGIEVLQHIRAHAIWRKIPVVIFSSSDYRGDIEQAYTHGAWSYMVKPVDFSELVVLMRRTADYWFGAVKIARWQ